MYFSGGIHRGFISGGIYPDACFAGTVQFYYAQLSNPELFSIHGICGTAADHLRCVLCPVFSRKAKRKRMALSFRSALMKKYPPSGIGRGKLCVQNGNVSDRIVS